MVAPALCAPRRLTLAVWAFLAAITLASVASACQDPEISATDAAETLRLAAVQSRDNGDTAQAVEYCRQAVEVLKAGAAPPAAIADALLNLTDALRNDARLAEAVLACQEALQLRTESEGADSKETRIVWEWLGYLAEERGYYDEAAVAYRRVFEIAVATEGSDDLVTARAAHGLAFASFEAGQEEDAVEFYRYAHRIRKEQLGETDADTRASLYQLATPLRFLGRLSEAETVLRECLRIAQAVDGPESRSVADCRHRLGLVLEAGADYDAAYAEYDSSLKLLYEIAQPGDTALAIGLADVARIYEATGRFTLALEENRKALAIWQDAVGEVHVRTARAWTDVGRCLFMLGRYVEALEAHQTALDQYRALFPSGHSLVSGGLSNVALMLQDMGQFERARPLYEEAIAIGERTQGGLHAWSALSVNLLGKLYWLQGLHAEAREQMERALPLLIELHGEHHNQVAYCYRDLGLLSMEEGQLDEASEKLSLAAEIWRTTYGSVHRLTAMAEHDLAEARARLGHVGEASELHESVLANRRALFAGNHEHTAESLHSLGVLNRKRGRLEVAQTLLADARAMREATLGETHPESIESLRQLALLERSFGRIESACQLGFEVQRRMDAHVAQVLWSLTESERFRFLKRRLEALEMLVALAAESGDPALIDRAYDGVLEWKGGATRALLAAHDRIEATADSAVEQQIAELHGVQAQLSRLLFHSGEETDEQRDAQLAELRTRRTNLELAINRAAGRIAPLPPLTWSQLRDALPADSAWVDFTILDLNLADDGIGAFRVDAWVLIPEAEHVQRIPLGGESRLQSIVQAFLEDLVVRRGGAAALAAKNSNDELREALWEPIAAATGGAPLLFANPASFLGGLPLETIRLADGQFVLEARSVVYVNDPAQLLAAPTPPVSTDLLCVGDVDFGSPAPGVDADSIWVPLASTRTEVDAITELHESRFDDDESRRLILLGADATEAAVRENARGFGTVHFATHGFFEREGLEWMWEKSFEQGQLAYRLADRHARLLHDLPGLFAGLVFAGGNAPSEAEGMDAYLTAEEVSWLDFADADLVVLSACETSLGRSQAGEGMLGLRRAFQMAGARTVISSLWMVRDASTSELMQKFYVNLWLKGLGKRAALRAAQIDLLDANRREFGEGRPSTWGGFVLSGDWR